MGCESTRTNRWVLNKQKDGSQITWKNNTLKQNIHPTIYPVDKYKNGRHVIINGCITEIRRKYDCDNTGAE